MIVTVAELTAWLATQAPEAEVRLAGVPDVGLVGWTDGTLGGNPVVVLAFAKGGGEILHRQVVET